MSKVQLGCGLAIGRQWGTAPDGPSETDAMGFLESAYEAGIRFFDTAPSYGMSEVYLGRFLSLLSPQQRNEVTIATKFGEHWDAVQQEAYSDHSFDAMKQSLDRSLSLLGTVALIQLHKTTPELLLNSDVDLSYAYAQELGIKCLGVSASDTRSAALTIEDERFSALQLPYNAQSTHFQTYVQQGARRGKYLIINRPFRNGQVLAENTASGKHAAAVAAFQLILSEDFEGAVLTGTSSASHLQENITAFHQAEATVSI